MTLAELKAWVPPYQQYVIDHGILVPGTKMIIFGKFQTWKSMLSNYTGFCIAEGVPWFGYRTHKTPTYLLQIENPQAQNRERVLKIAEGNSIQSDNIWFCTEPYIKLDKGFGIAELDKELSRTGARVLIVDPIYKVVSGRMTDEWDMRQFMDRMDLLMDKYKFSLILVHHDRKMQLIDGKYMSSGAEDMFGTSIFIDWCDTSIRTQLTGTDGEILLSFEKVRHSQDIIPGSKLVVKVDRATLNFSKKGYLELAPNS
jgi:RecA-family ATPase